jgi:hypothetical protein
MKGKVRAEDDRVGILIDLHGIALTLLIRGSVTASTHLSLFFIIIPRDG